MKIISKFKDYYDSSLGLGFDESLVYVRKSQVFTNTGRYRIKKGTWDHGWQDEAGESLPNCHLTTGSPGWSLSNSGDYPSKSHYLLHVSGGTIVFVGKEIPFIEVKWASEKSLNPNTPSVVDRFSYLYSIQEALAFFSKVEGKAHDRFNEEQLRKFFEPEGFARRNFTAWATENMCPIVYYGSARGHGQMQFKVPSYKRVDSLFWLNPRLACFDFHRHMPAHQVYQELAMFLGNIASRDDTPINISDKDRIIQHGFDNYSFRKAPTKNRA